MRHKPFKLLYQTIQDFTNDIIDVEVKLQQEVKATREYLKEKYQPAEVPKANPTEVGRVSITLDSSDEEREPHDFVRTLGVGPEGSRDSGRSAGRQCGGPTGFQEAVGPLQTLGGGRGMGRRNDTGLHSPVEGAGIPSKPPPGNVEAITQTGKAD